MKGCLLLAAAVFAAMTSTGHAQVPAPVTPESLVKAAKRAAGVEYAGTFLRICVAPDNLEGAAGRGAAPPAARTVPDRALWYAKPYKVFDNLYFVGTRIHSAWALTTLGLDPRNIKYVLISHAHGDHDQGAALLQSRYHAKIVMGAADWDSTLQRPASAPGGVPTRDVVVGPEGTKITLGDTTVDVIATPGHTPGTLSYIFTARDKGRPVVVAYAGGTAFNFPRRAENFAIYRDSQRTMANAAAGPARRS